VVLPALIGFSLLLTPTGRLPSPGWRWWARVAAAAPLVGVVSLALGPFTAPDQSVANPLAVGALAGPLLVMRPAAFVVAGLAIPVGAWSLLARFRRAGEVERQQLRWLMVDRRFNRRRHDAARLIEGFGARLLDQVDLDTLTAELLVVVDQTMAPTQASLWLQSPQEPPRALASP
jgi:hypothetical protein